MCKVKDSKTLNSHSYTHINVFFGRLVKYCTHNELAILISRIHQSRPIHFFQQQQQQHQNFYLFCFILYVSLGVCCVCACGSTTMIKQYRLIFGMNQSASLSLTDTLYLMKYTLTKTATAAVIAATGSISLS